MIGNQTNLIKPIVGGAYPVAKQGRGAYITDIHGKKYLDASSGAMTANIGHGVPEVARAIYEQAQTIAYVFRGQFTSEPAEMLARKIAEMAPGDLNSVFFVNSGSEATEIALKIAVQYWQEIGRPEKNRVISRWLSYHGVTLGALSMSGHPLRREKYQPLLKDFPGIVPPYCYRCPFRQTYPECGLLCADDAETAIRRIGPDSVAAIIVETVTGASGGVIVPPPGYYQRLAEICRKYQILLIADEVVTGFGRTGKTFAFEYEGILPDIVAVGKGLGGGYTPIGGAIVRDTVIEAIKNGSRLMMAGHTLSANPLSTATALAVLNYIEKHQLIDHARQQGKVLEVGLKELAKKYSFIGDIRGRGLLWGLEFVKDQKTKKPFSEKQNIAEKIITCGYKEGLLLYNASISYHQQSDAILLAPPFIVGEREINDLLKKLNRVLSQVAKGIP